MCVPQTSVSPDVDAVRFVRGLAIPPSSCLQGVLSRNVLGGGSFWAPLLPTKV